VISTKFIPHIGHIPTDWSMGKVSDLISNLDAGVSVNGEGRPAADGEYGVLKVSAVTCGQFKDTENKAILPQELKRSKVTPKKNCIIISRSNTPSLVGASAYIGRDYPYLFLPDKLWLASCDNGRTSMRWLGYYLASAQARYKLSNLATGTSSSMRNITKAEVLSLLVATPSLTEQNGIARVLETWDRAIEKTEALIEAKERRKKGLTQRLLTGKVRFGEFKDQEWRQYRLGALFTQRNERGREDLPLVSITMKGGVVPRYDAGKKDTSSTDKSRYLRICPGDVGYNTMRLWQGVSGVSSLEGIVSPAYTICIPGPLVDAEFMGYFFKSKQMVHLFYRYSQGLVSDTWNLKFRHFSKIKVKIPFIREQRKIANVFRDVDKDIKRLEKQLDILKTQKKGLMQQLLTGKVRVNAQAN